MAGGSGKYNRHLIAEMARGAQARPHPDHTARPTDLIDGLESLVEPLEHVGASEGRRMAGEGKQLGASSSSRPGARHVWVLGPVEDPGPHAGVIVGDWIRDRDQVTWCARVVWYSEAADVIVQQSLPATALRPALE